jgi:hypothetical protein
MATENGLYNTISTNNIVIIPDKSYKSLKLLNLRPGLCLLKQKAVILNICCVVRKVLVEQ